MSGRAAPQAPRIACGSRTWRYRRLAGRLDLPGSARPHPGDRHRRRGPQAVPVPPGVARAARSGEVRRDARLRPPPAATETPPGRGARARRDGPRTRARLRRPPARPRVLPDRQRDLRGAQRELRPGDDAQGARQHARAGRRRFDYPAKHGRRRVQREVDPVCGEIVATLRRRRGGGDELLAYKEGRRWRDVRSDEINDFIKASTGLDASAKDFRTWNATVLAGVSLAVVDKPASSRATERAIRWAIEQVAHHLGNTPAVARSAYIDPRISTGSATGGRSSARSRRSARTTARRSRARSSAP